MLRAVGMVSRVSRDSTSRRAFVWTSTTGVTPETVIVSSIEPISICALIGTLTFEATAIPLRLTVLNPVSENDISYTPGRRSTIE
jgi:hypothetical protein